MLKKRDFSNKLQNQTIIPLSVWNLGLNWRTTHFELTNDKGEYTDLIDSAFLPNAKF